MKNPYTIWCVVDCDGAPLRTSVSSSKSGARANFQIPERTWRRLRKEGWRIAKFVEVT